MSYLLALALALCWGSAALSIKNIVTVLPPYWSTFYRVLAGLLFFAVLYALQRKSVKISLKEIWRPWLLGFLLILLPFAALSWGQRFVSPTISGIFNGTVPIWSFIAGALILKGQDRFTWRRAAGVLFGLAGLLCITRPILIQVFSHVTSAEAALYGCVAFLIMAWSCGLGAVMTKVVMVDSSRVSYQANTFHQYLFSALVLLALSFSFEPMPPLASFTPKVVISILAAGVFSSAVAFLIMVYLLKRWGATRMASVAYCTPVITMLGDMALFGRMPGLHEIAGLLLIFVSLFLIQKPVQPEKQS